MESYFQDGACSVYFLLQKQDQGQEKKKKERERVKVFCRMRTKGGIDIRNTSGFGRLWVDKWSSCLMPQTCFCSQKDKPWQKDPNQVRMDSEFLAFSGQLECRQQCIDHEIITGGSVTLPSACLTTCQLTKRQSVKARNTTSFGKMADKRRWKTINNISK